MGVLTLTDVMTGRYSPLIDGNSEETASAPASACHDITAHSRYVHYSEVKVPTQQNKGVATRGKGATMDDQGGS